MRGPGALASSPSETEGVRCVGLGGEIVELVVEQHPGSRRHQADAIGKIQRIGIRHRIAVGIDDGEMRGLVALPRRGIARADLGRRTRARRRDRRAQRVGISLRGQPRDRNLVEIRIAEVFGAVGIGELHRLGHDMDFLGRVLAEARQRKALENVEDFDDVDAARGRRRHRDDRMAAIGAADRHPLARAIGRQIIETHVAARAIDRGDDFGGDGALVEGVGAAVGDRAQSRGEIVLVEPFAAVPGRTVGMQEHRPARRIDGKPLGRLRQRIGEILVDDENRARKRDRRRQRDRRA